MLPGAVGCCVDTHVGIQPWAGAWGAPSVARAEPVADGDDGVVAHASAAPAPHVRATTMRRHALVRLDATAAAPSAPPANALRQSHMTDTTRGCLDALGGMPRLISRKRFQHTKLRVYGKPHPVEQRAARFTELGSGWHASAVSLS
jgi:hypothetical protein